MRNSVAKRLRRITMNTPKSPRTYTGTVKKRAARVPIEVDPKGFILIDRVTFRLANETPRAKYQRAKMLYKFAPKLFAKNVIRVGI